jgi:dienelactone hydrolase
MTALDKLTFEHAGAWLAGEVARPAGDGPFPAVLVMASALGLSPQMRESAGLLAAQGYLAVATDMFGDGAYFADPTKAGDDYAVLMASPELLRARVVAWFETVAALPDVDATRIAAIGYCFGGCCVLELARSGVDVKAVVSYHGILTSQNPAAPGVIKGEVVAYCGGKDPYAPEDTIAGLHRELTEAGASHHITVFAEAQHSFTDVSASKHGRPGIAYDAIAHRVSWAGTLALLETVLQG